MNWLKRNWKKILTGIVIVLALAAAYIFWPIKEDLSSLADRAANYDVTILRDTYGVPHVFGHTDADAAYGFGYAHSEDDFLTIQQVLLAARGDLATVYGPDSAPADYLVEFLRVWDVVDAEYEKLSPDTRKIVEAYADGLNVYAAHHPEEALPGLFPVNGKDIVAASVEKSPLFFGLDSTIGHLFSDDPEPVPTPTKVAYNWLYGMTAFNSNSAPAAVPGGGDAALSILNLKSSVAKIPQPKQKSNTTRTALPSAPAAHQTAVPISMSTRINRIPARWRGMKRTSIATKAGIWSAARSPLRRSSSRGTTAISAGRSRSTAPTLWMSIVSPSTPITRTNTCSTANGSTSKCAMPNWI